jgi:hypothetical protein
MRLFGKKLARGTFGEVVGLKCDPILAGKAPGVVKAPMPFLKWLQAES